MTTKKAEPKRIVITGCSRGLGLALAGYFTKQGHTVIGCGRSGGPGRSEVHSYTNVDVGNDTQVSRWAKQIIAEGGPPDLLINNAAIILPNAPLWQIGDANFQRLLDINVKGVVSTIRHFAPAMIKQGRGVIVNFSSGWGRSTAPEVATYCASKWAIEGLTQALAQELPRGLAAVALNPGIIDTDMLRSCFGQGAGSYPDPAEWVKHAGPFILRLGAKDNGRSLDVSGVPVE